MRRKSSIPGFPPIERRTFTPNERLAVYIRDDGVCGICERHVEPAETAVDHIIPIAKGGRHEPDNWQLAHRNCNAVKRDDYPATTLGRELEARDRRLRQMSDWVEAAVDEIRSLRDQVEAQDRQRGADEERIEQLRGIAADLMGQRRGLVRVITQHRRQIGLWQGMARDAHRRAEFYRRLYTARFGPNADKFGYPHVNAPPDEPV